MGTLTLDKILQLMRELPEREPDPFAPLFPRSHLFAGMKVFERRPPPPKIQCRELLFDDGTPILTPEFRAQTNSWLLERFGRAEDLFKDQVFVVSGRYLFATPSQICVIRNLGV